MCNVHVVLYLLPTGYIIDRYIVRVYEWRVPDDGAAAVLGLTKT